MPSFTTSSSRYGLSGIWVRSWSLQQETWLICGTRLRVRMAFVANRPEKVMNIPYDPVEMTFRVANMLTLGASNKLAERLDLG
jgi:hypothetical protein